MEWISNLIKYPIAMIILLLILAPITIWILFRIGSEAIMFTINRYKEKEESNNVDHS